MPAIVQFPTVVQEAVGVFGPLFANGPERRHLAEYLTGLIVADRKNVSGINREFAVTTDQSNLNRWLTEAEWDAAALNELRLGWLQQDPGTRYHAHGVIPIDNVLVDHDGKLIEDAGWFWDHAERRNKIAHDYVIVNYVCASGKHYPLEFRRFVKRDQCGQQPQPTPAGEGAAAKPADGKPADGKPAKVFKGHNELVRELVDWVVERAIPGDFAFDSYFTNAGNLNHIHGVGRGYVGDLKFNRNVTFMGRETKAEQVAAGIKPADRKAVEVGGKKQWYFTKTVSIPDVGHPVRLLTLWENRNDANPRKILVTNRTHWEVSRILRVYRRRWRGTECFHRDGKQHLGMGECQVRNGRGQTRHMYLVFLSHALLMRPLKQVKQGRARAWALQRLTTIGQARLAVMRQTLSDTISWVLERFTLDNWSIERIKTHLALP